MFPPRVQLLSAAATLALAVCLWWVLGPVGDVYRAYRNEYD